MYQSQPKEIIFTGIGGLRRLSIFRKIMLIAWFSLFMDKIKAYNHGQKRWQKLTIMDKSLQSSTKAYNYGQKANEAIKKKKKRGKKGNGNGRMAGLCDCFWRRRAPLGRSIFWPRRWSMEGIYQLLFLPHKPHTQHWWSMDEEDWKELK